MPVGRTNSTIPASGRVGAQSLGTAVARVAEKLGVRGDAAAAKKKADATAKAEGEAFRAAYAAMGTSPKKAAKKKGKTPMKTTATGKMVALGTVPARGRAKAPKGR